jgi:formylmethanofuran dehydrogenase subunit C
MPHVQAKLDDPTFREVKKDAIDKDKSIGDYVKDAVVAELERGKTEAGKETPNKPN